ncbi:MAG: type II toxin-antitoxin system RelE/ParE family toxin [Flavobacteriaceae bacterium]|nr:type II toxin-antitoxin system RelE/ParE family toxin [Flavobacteriaceae bacterium]
MASNNINLLWTPDANSSLEEEIDFILRKWNFVEAEKFSVLVEKHLNLLQSGSFLGIYISDIDIYKCVISKQTSLIY